MSAAALATRVGPPSRWRVLRVALLSLSLCGLSLSLVFGPRDAAVAYSVAPGPVTLAGALKSPPARLFSMTPWGRGITAAVGLGILAYETRDAWLPAVKSLMNPGDGVTGQGSSKTTSGSYCGSAVLALSWSGSQQVTGQASGMCTRSNVTGFSPHVTVQWWARCIPAGGGQPSATWTSEGVTTVPEVNGPFKVGQWITTPTVTVVSPALCGAGKPAAVDARPSSSGFSPLTGAMLTSSIPDSEFEQETAVTCKNVETGATATFTETLTGEPDKVAIPSCADRMPGSVPWSFDVKGGRAGVRAPLTSGTVDQALFNEWRDCWGAGGLKCKTQVFIDGQACVMGNADCRQWWDISKADPERVNCKFGTHLLPLSDCKILRYAYQASKVLTKTVTQTETKADPDVKTGEPQTNPNPPVEDALCIFNGTCSAPPLTPDPPSDPLPETSDKGCLRQAVSLNPVDWVFVPVRCALKWAFVPKTPFAARMGRIKDVFAPTIPFGIPGWLNGMSGNVGEGCPDWRIRIPGGHLDKSVVCESSFTHAIRSARPALTAGMVVMAFWPLVRSLYYSSFPIFKPAPTGGKA